ncbi:MAG: LysM peptidoglycan-binding domain-containing protein [Acidimicrobiales bacterium]
MRAQRPLLTTIAVVTLAALSLVSTGPHTVRSGETLAGIAARNGVSVSALAKANAIADPNRIVVGQRLTIPGAGAPAAAGSYTVRTGDALGTIASRHGSSVAALVGLNALANPNLIRVGQVLKVPTAGAATPAAPATKAPAGGATTHVVRSGDTISGVASRYGISQAQLIDANGLTGGRIYLGQQLRLVPTARSAGAPPSTSTYTVRSGDSLSTIARRFGTTIKALQDANGLSNPNVVVIGRPLAIPGGGTGGGGAIRCPVQGGTTFMNDWGFSRSGGRFHEGNDLFAPRGRSAVATVSGTVVQTTGRLAGNQVNLVGDDGVTYYYMHLDRFGSNGRVAAGTVIGYVGSTGNAVGGPNHVHFEVHPGGGAAVNPYPRLSAVC